MRDTFVPLGHHGLHSDRAFDRIDHRWKLKQHAVARGLDDAAPVPCHESIGHGAVFAERASGADLISTHQTAVSGDIRRQNCRKPPFHAIVGHNNTRDRLTYQSIRPCPWARANVGLGS